MKIGIFDSGVGGLSVLKKIREKIDFADIIYYGDSLHSPYGIRSEKEILKFCMNIVDFLIDNRVDIIVVACNTATAIALDKLKERFTSVPIIGVIVPGATSAVKNTKNKKIGIIATPVTIKSGVYKKAIKKINSKVEVSEEACELLCPLIENNWNNNYKNYSILKNYMDKLPESIDTLILGCTHYPLIIEDIKKIFTKTIIDPADETSIVTLFELNKIALKTGIKKQSKLKINIDYFISGDIEKFREVAEIFLEEKITSIYQPIIEY